MVQTSVSARLNTRELKILRKTILKGHMKDKEQIMGKCRLVK